MVQSPLSMTSLCPISVALDCMGDAWTMKIIRDMVFKNHKHFHMFMKSPGKISSNILSDRLQKLEEIGFISKSCDPHDKRKVQYQLTEKGLELIPLLLELIQLGYFLGGRDFPTGVISELKSNRSLLLSKLKQQHKPISRDLKSRKRHSSPLASQTLSLFD